MDFAHCLEFEVTRKHSISETVQRLAASVGPN